MAATPAGTTRPRRSAARPMAQRLSTETKHSSKTSELYAFVAVVLGILAAAALIKGGDSGGTDEFIARQAWLYVSIVTAAYMISRGLAKAGSRDPYTADAHDHDGNGSH
ncbi:MAG: hypothetical protein AVDCRST_MAG67-4415 [uncultured Solirubrobacteraceae bacterium]|uniref:Uncharacterized protein n=1 Tax=uncultured Solirubrobacteraceae bacterium TaxID=1162706 RepID=A0A6J4TUC0_9ACTN|nr:MAG: hypothetical protein AVDCRST_MAG67-4415 [uncultured Solirubrobacteraceae bacterium]